MSIQVTLPDGSVQTVETGAKPIDVARAISPRLADDAIVARVNGDLWDLNRAFEADSSLQILTTKNPEALEVYRHRPRICLPPRCSNCFRKPSLALDRPSNPGSITTSSGRFRFTNEDLEKIEKRMWEIQARDLPYERKYT